MTRGPMESALHHNHKFAGSEMAIEPEPTSKLASTNVDQRHGRVKFRDLIVNVPSTSPVTSEAAFTAGIDDAASSNSLGSEYREMRQTLQSTVTDTIQLEELRIKRVQEEQKLAQEAQKRAQEELKLVQEKQRLALVEQELVRLQIEARKADLQVIVESSQHEVSQPDTADPQTSPVLINEESTEPKDPPAESVVEYGSQNSGSVSLASQPNDYATALLPDPADVPSLDPLLYNWIVMDNRVEYIGTVINGMNPESVGQGGALILNALNSSHADTGEGGPTLDFVARTIIERACTFPGFAHSAAKLCKFFSDSINPTYTASGIVDPKGNPVHGAALFRKFLLNRCQTSFERCPSSWDDPLARTHDLELTSFIGELYKQGMLTTRIIQECLARLFHFDRLPNPAAMELLVTLLRTVMSAMDASEEGRTLTSRYIDGIALIMKTEDLPLRTRDLLQALIDDYNSGWF